MAKKYKVFVYDNYHYMDESEVYQHGDGFDDCESAVAACKQIVDEFLLRGCGPGVSADELFRQYTMFGEDPMVAGEDCTFSAWTYARQRCRELCCQSGAL